MEIGMIGLGRMGAPMTIRLLRGGHRVVGYDRSPRAVQGVVAHGAVGAESLEASCRELAPPRAVWLMVPAGVAVDHTIDSLLPYLSTGDTLVDGGNSHFKDSMRRAASLEAKGLHFVDVGTSGGIWGLTEGYSLMIGGEETAVQRLHPIFETLAPAPDRGWGHVGLSGAGHFVKMIHNGIEYGLMQAYAEGFDPPSIPMRRAPGDPRRQSTFSVLWGDHGGRSREQEKRRLLGDEEFNFPTERL